MKMESTITSTQEGVVKRIYLKEGTLLESNDLVLEF
jgi:pyruvate carboxylase